MSHMLARLKGHPAGELKRLLLNDAPEHAKEGLFLEHFWTNGDDPAEAYFLFRVDDLDRARTFIKRVHTEALAQNPDVNLPVMLYLEEK